MSPQISILMPVFNAADLLPACLESIAAQSFTDYELVAVDDGSQDGGAQLLAEAARRDPRIVLLRMEHAGIVGALNLGLRACRGRYIVRMDSDDLMHPRRLERQLAFMGDEPDIDLCGALVRAYGIGCQVSPASQRYHDWLNTLVHDAEIRRGIFVDSPIAHSTFFAKRELYQRLAGYHDCAWAEDYDFLFRALHAGARFGKVAEVLLDRGDCPGRLTRNDPHYKREAMSDAKAHHFAAGGWLRGKAGVVVLGSGPSGRMMAAAFGAFGVTVRAFLDNRPGPPGRKVMGIPAYGDPEGPSPERLASMGDAFFALCIGEVESRRRIAGQLEMQGFLCGRDFLRFI